MSNLHIILNPEDGSIITQRLDSEILSPAIDMATSIVEDIVDKPKQPKSARYIQEFNRHEPHKDCPDTLACLPDTDGRPQHTLPVILRCAILGSPRRRLTIREIYAAMEDKYAYYKTAGPTWKQSVRHHLSLNRLFERQTRPVTDPGFGSYWTVNLEAPPGTKRPRKRGRPAGKESTPDGATSTTKKRGRPRKSDTVSEVPSIATLPLADDRSLRTCQVSSVRTHREDEDDEDDEDEEMMSPADFEGSEDYESEEDMVPPNHRPSVGLNAFGVDPSPASTRLSRVTAFTNYGRTESRVDRMENEMAALRRQCSDTTTLSLRLSDQLNDAQAEMGRVKGALDNSQQLLADEARKRMEAEMLAEEQRKAKIAVEEELARLRALLPASIRSVSTPNP